MKIIKLTVICIIAALICTGCSILMSKLYGIKEIKQFNEKEYLSFISEIKKQIDFATLVSDSNQYNRVFNIVKDAEMKKHFAQPVQILYFDKSNLVSFHINCLAKGSFTNLNWNTDNRFSTFIPKSAINVDSLAITLNEYSNIYNEINTNSDKQYTILIFWTLALKKVSNTAIETVIENLNKFGKAAETDLYLINTDKWFVGKF